MFDFHFYVIDVLITHVLKKIYFFHTEMILTSKLSVCDDVTLLNSITETIYYPLIPHN